MVGLFCRIEILSPRTEARGKYFYSTNNRVGIGTTTPNWNLQIAGTRPLLTLSDAGANTDSKHWFLSSQGGNFYIGTSTDALSATSTYLTITNRGFVGIGTTSPGANLDVFNANNATGFIRVSGNRNAAGGHAARIDLLAPQSPASADQKNFAIVNINTPGGTTNNFFTIRQYNDAMTSASARDILTISNGGSVAGGVSIGSYAYSTIPAPSNGLIIGGSVGIGTSTPNRLLQIAGNAGPQLLITQPSAGTDLKHWYASTTAGSLTFGTLNDALSTLTERMRIDSLGRIGIGTTTPTTMFQVATSTSNATTTIEIGKTGQNKGSCLKLYDTSGNVVYCSVTGTAFSCSATSCE